MSNIKIDELQKVYDDSHIDAFVQEICEYYATRDEYASSSDQDDIEPSYLVEPVFMLFCLQDRENILDELNYIHQKYPHLSASVQDFGNQLLTHMDIDMFQSELEHKLTEATKGLSSAAIYDVIERVCRENTTAPGSASEYTDLSGAMEDFYKWLSNGEHIL